MFTFKYKTVIEKINGQEQLYKVFILKYKNWTIFFPFVYIPDFSS